MQKAYSRIVWENLPSTNTALDAENLNTMDSALDTIDDRVVNMDTTKADQSDLLADIKNVTFDSSTGTFTFTKQNGTTIEINTDIEKIAVNFDYDDDPTSPHYQNLVITLDDGTVKYVDLSALITQYEFSDTTTIHFTVSAGGGISANVIDGSITESKLQPNFLADCRAAKSGAESAESGAEAKALVAEGYANGKQNGVPVGSSSPYYHNNAEYFKDQAAAIVSASIAGLSDVDIDTQTLSNGQILKYNSTSQMWENKDEAEGVLPHLIITTDTGSTVTATKGGVTVTATETSTGVFECDINDYGTWTITSSLNGSSVTDTLSVDTVKIYNVSISQFSASITVTYPSGATVTCSKGGESYTATSSPYTFTVGSSGTWTITATKNGVTKTYPVSITTSGQTESVTVSFVPDGSTVTPTDDIQTWLNCADIWDKSYTTLAEVLADSTTLLALISSSNAVDYMVRSTTWASGTCADSTAMSYIGLNNYCANTLLADSTWCEAICNSEYFESVLNVKVPAMTSDTTPSGLVFFHSEESSLYAYHTFDRDEATRYVTANYEPIADYLIGYAFPSSKRIYKAEFKGGGGGTWTLGIYSGNSTSDLVSVSGTNTTVADQVLTFNYILTDNTAKTHFAMKCTTSNRSYMRVSGDYGFSLYEAQFYGREDV